MDGILRELGDVQYLLSPQDLAAVELVPELVQAGVTCFKIEGGPGCFLGAVCGGRRRWEGGCKAGQGFGATAACCGAVGEAWGGSMPCLPCAHLPRSLRPPALPAGRLKGPEYVAACTQVYRRAVDAAWEALTAGSSGGSGVEPAEAERGAGDAAAEAAEAAEAGRLRLSEGEWRDLQQVFARGQDSGHGGLTPGFLEGSFHQRLVRGRNPRHRGNLLGTVERVGG